MSKDRRLGRGLAALLGTPNEGLSAVGPVDRQAVDHVFQHEPRPSAEAAARAVPEDGLLQLNVYEIDDNPFQPRRDFGDAEIASLAESLKEHDMLQPVLVRRAGDRYPADLRRAAVAGGHPGRLVHDPRPAARGRRSPGGGTGHRREPAAQGPEPDREGDVLQALSRRSTRARRRSWPTA